MKEPPSRGKSLKIYLPHIHYTVMVKARSLAPEKLTDVALTVRETANRSTVYIDKPTKLSHMGLLAHELTHVLQNICRDRHMEFTYECEHMGYLMQLMMGKVLGLSYED